MIGFNLLDDANILWIIFSLLIGVALAVDLGLLNGLRNRFSKKVHRTRETSSSGLTLKKAGIWTAVWISLAGIFAALIYMSLGSEKTLEFVTAYIVEKSLSVDNMFVFALIFSTLAIPYAYQHKVLIWGVIGAIVMRIAFITAGVSLVESFHWMTYVLGALVLFTSIKLLLQKNRKIDLERNIAVRFVRKLVPISTEISNDRFTMRSNGVLYATPLLLALAVIEMTDLIFALDSIPAVLALTTDLFIVITSNIFAILGLRSLYFLIAGSIEKFTYLKYGLATILVFIGIKMLASDALVVPISISLAVIVGVLATTISISLLKKKLQISKIPDT